MRVMVPEHLIDELLPQLRAINPAVGLISVPVDGHYSGRLDRLKVLLRFFPNDRFPGEVLSGAILRAILNAATQLRWIHNGTTGVGSLLIPELVNSNIILTNSAGAHKRTLAESVLGFILADAKALPGHLHNKQQKRWQHLPHTALHGHTVAILGLGHVGLEIARLCRALDMRVIGIKRTISAEPLPGIEAVFRTA